MNESLIIFGFTVPAVTMILIVEGVFLFILLTVDIFLTKGAVRAGLPAHPGMNLLLAEVFFSFAIISAFATYFGVGPDDLGLIMICLIMFGFFIRGIGITYRNRNLPLFIAAFLGSIVGPLVLVPIIKSFIQAVAGT